METWNSVPEFDDANAKVRTKEHRASGAEITEVTYGALDQEGNPTEPEKFYAEGHDDGHGKWTGIKLGDVYHLLSWKKPASEGETEVIDNTKEVLSEIETVMKEKKALVDQAFENLKKDAEGLEAFAAIQEKFEQLKTFGAPREMKLMERFSKAIENPKYKLPPADQARLDRAASLYTVEFAASRGIELHYVNTRVEDPVALLMDLSGGKGYDDVFCFAPVPAVVEQADDILAFDGCLNFFAGPSKAPFKAPFNFYNVHYNSTHVVGTSGGNTDDMKEALHYMGKGMDPAGLVTHIGGLGAVIDTTVNLPSIPGGKKLIYTHIDLPLTAIADFGQSDNPVLQELDRICQAHNGLWNVEAETYLLAHAAEL